MHLRRLQRDIQPDILAHDSSPRMALLYQLQFLPDLGTAESRRPQTHSFAWRECGWLLQRRPSDYAMSSGRAPSRPPSGAESDAATRNQRTARRFRAPTPGPRTGRRTACGSSAPEGSTGGQRHPCSTAGTASRPPRRTRLGQHLIAPVVKCVSGGQSTARRLPVPAAFRRLLSRPIAMRHPPAIRMMLSASLTQTQRLRLPFR